MALPIPQIITALNLAYQHRDKAAEIHEKFKQWRGDNKEFPTAPADADSPTSLDDRVESLEQSANFKDALDQEQSALIADISNDISNLALLSGSISKKLNLIALIAIASLCCAVVALIITLNQ